MLIISDADDVTARCKQRAAYVNKVESSLSKRPLPCRELNGKSPKNFDRTPPPLKLNFGTRNFIFTIKSVTIFSIP